MADTPLAGMQSGEGQQPNSHWGKSGERRRKWTTTPAEGVDLLVRGDAGRLEAEAPTTVGRMFGETVGKLPDHLAHMYKENGQWKAVTYKQYYDRCLAAAKSFLKVGLEPLHGVAIMGFNSPEWMVCDVGAIFAGGLPTGIYTTSKPDACQYVANNCSANVICVEDDKQLSKILQIRDQLPHLKAIVHYKGKLSQQYPNVFEWEQFMELGKDMDDSVIEEKIKAQRPDQCALL